MNCNTSDNVFSNGRGHKGHCLCRRFMPIPSLYISIRYSVISASSSTGADAFAPFDAQIIFQSEENYFLVILVMNVDE